MENNVCRQHSGIDARINDCEKNIDSLWSKWDSLQKWLFVSLGMLLVNLIGVIFILVRVK